jgi:hypothetical protein
MESLACNTSLEGVLLVCVNQESLNSMQYEERSSMIRERKRETPWGIQLDEVFEYMLLVPRLPVPVGKMGERLTVVRYRESKAYLGQPFAHRTLAALAIAAVQEEDKKEA